MRIANNKRLLEEEINLNVLLEKMDDQSSFHQNNMAMQAAQIEELSARLERRKIRNKDKRSWCALHALFEMEKTKFMRSDTELLSSIYQTIQKACNIKYLFTSVLVTINFFD